MEDRTAHVRLPPSLRSAYGQAQAALRLGNAGTAERQLRAILAAAPGEPASLHLLGAALLAQGRVEEALTTLEAAVTAAPGFAPARVDLARAYRQAGRTETARETLRTVVKAAPRLPAGWLAYGDVLVELAKHPDAQFAYEQARLLDPNREAIEQATAAFVAGDRQSAEGLFRQVLKADASHVGALCGLAAIALSTGATADAERLVRHAGKQTAHAPLVQRALAHTLIAAGRLTEAEAATRELLAIEPENPQSWVALGTVLTRLLRQEEALAAYEEAARLNPAQVALRLTIGHVLKTLGRREACEQAYHQCLAMDPACAEAWWSLADLKTYVFEAAEVEAMRTLLADPAVDETARAHLHFALGRALEHQRRYPEAFGHYATGNGLRRKASPFDIEAFERKSWRVAQLFDRSFLQERSAAGCPDAAPIFIVGLPRSGSTLVEQILASHSQVEGTMELPNILTLVRELERREPRGDAYPESLRQLPPGQLAALGRRYLEETRALRAGRPRFIDKMPNNFSHVGLIHLILPEATVIDVRRHPMDACFSTYKQHFAEGQSFSYDLADLGRYYRCYLELMDHWDGVLPGRVLHLQYEELVRDSDTQIRRLLAHCGLGFEEACLAFHQTQRPVRTASAEQVRQPLYSSGLGYWRNFAQELEPLRASLGDCLLRFTDLS